jgi:hypothetical protein
VTVRLPCGQLHDLDKFRELHMPGNLGHRAAVGGVVAEVSDAEELAAVEQDGPRLPRRPTVPCGQGRNARSTDVVDQRGRLPGAGAVPDKYTDAERLLNVRKNAGWHVGLRPSGERSMIQSSVFRRRYSRIPAKPGPRV